MLYISMSHDNQKYAIPIHIFYSRRKNNKKLFYQHNQKKHTKRVTKKETLEQEGTKIIIECAVEIPENAPDRE